MTRKYLVVWGGKAQVGLAFGYWLTGCTVFLVTWCICRNAGKLLKFQFVDLAFGRSGSVLGLEMYFNPSFLGLYFKGINSFYFCITSSLFK